MRKLRCGELASAVSSMLLKPCSGAGALTAAWWGRVQWQRQPAQAGALPSLQGKPWCQQRKGAHLSVSHAATAPLEQHNRALRNESERHHLRQPRKFVGALLCRQLWVRPTYPQKAEHH